MDNTLHRSFCSLSLLVYSAVRISLSLTVLELPIVNTLNSFDTVVCHRGRRFHDVSYQTPRLISVDSADVFLYLPFSFVGLAEDPQVLAIRAPQLFSVSDTYRAWFFPYTDVAILCTDDRTTLSARHQRSERSWNGLVKVVDGTVSLFGVFSLVWNLGNPCYVVHSIFHLRVVAKGIQSSKETAISLPQFVNKPIELQRCATLVWSRLVFVSEAKRIRDVMYRKAMWRNVIHGHGLYVLRSPVRQLQQRATHLTP